MSVRFHMGSCPFAGAVCGLIFSDINSWQNLRYTLRVRYIFDAICPAGREGIYIISQGEALYRICKTNISHEQSEYIAKTWHNPQIGKSHVETDAPKPPSDEGKRSAVSGSE